MKKIFIMLLTICICFFSSFYSTRAFIGLTAEPGDILNIAKWNELVTELNTKIQASNIVAGSNISVTTSRSNVTISSTGIATVTSTNRDDSDISSTRYYGVQYSDNTWKIDREIGSGTGTVRTTATDANNAGQSTYSAAWIARGSLNYQ